MKIHNKITGKKNINNIIQIENGNINIENIPNKTVEDIIIPVAKEKTIRTKLSPTIATLIAAIALIVDISALILTLSKFPKGNFEFSNFKYLTIILVMFISFGVLFITKELRKKKFSLILPLTNYKSKFIWRINNEGKIVLEKLTMDCPKCKSSMSITFKDGYYSMICDRYLGHYQDFDFTTLDNIK